jgi:hypothetical protein
MLAQWGLAAVVYLQAAPQLQVRRLGDEATPDPGNRRHWKVV